MAFPISNRLAQEINGHFKKSEVLVSTRPSVGTSISNRFAQEIKVARNPTKKDLSSFSVKYRL